MPKTEADSPLTTAQVQNLERIIHLYVAQLERCTSANAPLASCIMAGAIVEATL